jgi:hypothetical protein
MMAKVETAPTIKSLIEELHQLSDEEQRLLAGAVLDDRKLEPFVEEIEDNLNCEQAANDGPAELFVP